MALTAEQSAIHGEFGMILKIAPDGRVIIDFSHHNGMMGITEELKNRYLWMAKTAVEEIGKAKSSRGIGTFVDERVFQHMIPGPVVGSGGKILA